MLDDRHRPAARLCSTKSQRGFKGVPHDAYTHCSDHRGAHAERLLDDLGALAWWSEQIGMWNAEVSEARMWSVDGFVAAEFGVREDLVG